MIKGTTTISKFRLHDAAAVCLAIALAILPNQLSAQTLTNPTEIIAPQDYPTDSLMRGDEGTTSFRLTLTANGRARNCEVVQSSGFAELDAATCRLMLERAKFDMSAVPSSIVSPTFASRVRWTIPSTQDPRPLLFGVTVSSSPHHSDPAKTKCEYSDGQVRIVEASSSCVRNLPKLSIRRNGILVQSNIFDQYMYEADRLGNAASAFNVGLLLLDDGYKEGLRYLQKSSSLGNHLASAVLCNVYAIKELSSYVDFNPNQALEYCILSYRQQYSGAPFTFYNEIMKKYGNLIDPEVSNRARNTIVLKNQTAFSRMVTPGNEVVRSKDYPNKENSRQIGGRTQVAIEISEQGRVRSCLVVKSTYSYDLDQRVCTRFREAAAFTPAVIDGKPAVEWTTKWVNWVPGGRGEPSTGSIILQLLLGVLGASL